MAALAAFALFWACGDGSPGELVALDAGVCLPFAAELQRADERAACEFRAGATPAATTGLTPADVARIPISHVIIRMQENRSFDHYLGQLPRRGHPEVDGLPVDEAGVANASCPDLLGASVRSFRLESTCLEADPPHQYEETVLQWNEGALDGFVRAAAMDRSVATDGRYVMGYYDEEDLPFYYWAARTFAISDRHFSATLGGTWSNRNVLYSGSPHGVRSTLDGVTIGEYRDLFDQLDDAGVSWGIYLEGEGNPRQDSLGLVRGSPGVHPIEVLWRGLRGGRLPQVIFVDTTPSHEPGSPDEHPANDVQPGEAWSRRLYEAVVDSPLWPRLAMFWLYDTHGGLYDHVPPGPACVPTDEPKDAVFDRHGFRVPFFVISPWARPGYVSHTTRDHASVLRFVQLLHGLPSLTHRDANADPLLELFDFDCEPELINPPPAPAAGVGGC